MGESMIGLGTLINTGAVIAGGIIGLVIKNGLKKQMQESLMLSCGVATIFIGVAGAISKMLTLSAGAFGTQKTMLLILSLVFGTATGELIHLEDKMDVLGEKIKRMAKREDDNRFVEGFVSVSLIICIGAMAIVGSIQDGISGNYAMLAAKAVLDAIIVMIFASTYGIGAIFSAIPVFVYQGVITLIAALCGTFVSDAIITDLSFIGSALIFCVGINIAFGKKFRVANMLPAILVPIIYNVAVSLFHI
jgi:uncharacterized membrane protein YqgA involved in biofilm formation